MTKDIIKDALQPSAYKETYQFWHLGIKEKLVILQITH